MLLLLPYAVKARVLMLLLLLLLRPLTAVYWCQCAVHYTTHCYLQATSAAVSVATSAQQ
jgi:hypothetical protein